MIEQDFVFEKYDWDIIVFYEVECKDTNVILHELKSIGCHGDQLFRARQNLESCERNIGITFANMSTKEMVVVMTKSTSPKQFLNTMIHELHHMAEFICRADNIPLVGEEISYISGDLSMMMFDKARHMMCPHCRKDNNDTHENN